jgi:hypothetical protein
VFPTGDEIGAWKFTPTMPAQLRHMSEANAAKNIFFIKEIFLIEKSSSATRMETSGARDSPGARYFARRAQHSDQEKRGTKADSAPAVNRRRILRAESGRDLARESGSNFGETRIRRFMLRRGELIGFGNDFGHTELDHMVRICAAGRLCENCERAREDAVMMRAAVPAMLQNHLQRLIAATKCQMMIAV